MPAPALVGGRADLIHKPPNPWRNANEPPHHGIMPVLPVLPAPSTTSAPSRASCPPGSSRDVSARAVLARFRPRVFDPALGPLRPQELAALRCRGLDERILTCIGAITMPRDLVRTAGARARALAAAVPDGGIIITESAMWVHLGGEPPPTIHVAHPGRRGWTRAISYSRMAIPPEEVETVGGVPCSALARAVVDVARTAPPARAVEAVIRARDAGLSRNRLNIALLTCQGAARRGRPRATRIIDAIMPPHHPPGRRPRPVEAQT